MGLLGNLFGKKETPIKSNNDFWNWFLKNERDFFKVVKEERNIERDFFNKLSSKLNQLRDGYWFLAGMCDENTAELILTPDGVVRNIVFVEELVQSAPKISNWKFTALKPALNINDVYISMGDLKFNKENLSFYPNSNPKYPDDIDITVVYSAYSEDLKDSITNGVYIFLDNYLGELNFISTIDNIQVVGIEKDVNELIPIEKLMDFLLWRQKEFIEKYEGTRYNTENDTYTTLEATLNNGNPLVALVNSNLLDWDRKASHPWILTIEIKYKGNVNGMPDKETFDIMNAFEDELILKLKDSEGYLNVGRQTADGSREIFFACKDFRVPSLVLTEFIEEYKNRLSLGYEIYKDKYWKSFERFEPRY